MKKKNKHILLKGEGANQHTIYGDFNVSNDVEFAKVNVLKDSELKHEQPDGTFGEHHTLKISKGGWVMGKQVEYNPFSNRITQVWD